MQSLLLENEIGAGMLQSSFQQTQTLKERLSHKTRATDFVLILCLLCDNFADHISVECWTGALQVQLRFFKIDQIFLLEILY